MYFFIRSFYGRNGKVNGDDKRVILLAGHNFISPRCNTNIDGKLITEFDMISYLVAEVFKRGIDLIIKAKNDFGNLVNEVNSLNGDILISCHFNP